jgi:hypothetical protein
MQLHRSNSDKASVGCMLRVVLLFTPFKHLLCPHRRLFHGPVHARACLGLLGRSDGRLADASLRDRLDSLDP